MFEKALVVTEHSSNFDIVLHSLPAFMPLGLNSCLVIQNPDPLIAHETVSSIILDLYRGNLQRQEKILAGQGITAESRELTGMLTVSDINQLIKETDCSLVVTGSATHSRLGEVMFSGAAQFLMHGCASPLLIVRLPAAPLPKEEPMQPLALTRHVLFPTDFSVHADHAFAYLQQMVAAGLGKVTLVHIQEKTRIEPHLTDRLDEFNQTDLARLAQMAEALKQAGPVEVAVELAYGSPTAEIMKIVKDREISLVVMSSQGRGWIKEIYLGSVSHNIARHSPVSVLLIPAIH